MPRKDRLLNHYDPFQSQLSLAHRILPEPSQGRTEFNDAIIGAASNSDITMSEVYSHYRVSKRRHRSIKEIERIFERHILPVFGTSRIAAIDRAHVTLLLDRVASAGPRPAPVMARAVGAQFSAFYSWAIARHSFLTENPCRLAARPPRPRPRSRILTDQELRTLWRVLEAEGTPWRNAIRLILLTGQRRREVFEAEWVEFDLDRRMWTIPATHSKNGREHRVPLSPESIDLLEAIPRGASAKLFPARGRPERGASGFSKAMKRINLAVRAADGAGATFTLQDLRRTVATGLQRLGVKLEVTESVLNHISGTRDGVVGIYQRYQFEDEKRIALNRWAIELVNIVASDCQNARTAAVKCP